MNRQVWRVAVCFGAAAWTGVPLVLAQPGQVDVGEIAAGGGGLFGGGSHPAATGSAGVAVSRYALVLFDTSYASLGRNTIQPWPPASTINRSYLLDFGFDANIRVPLKHHWEPYGILGAGALWNIIRQNTFDAHGIPVVRHFDQWNGAFHTGGGVRYYIGHDWGIRPECKVIVSKQAYAQLTIGIFWVTPPDWP